MNTCAKCLTEKPRSAFGADKRNSTGLQSICNQCYKDKRNGIEATCDKAKCSKCKEIKKISDFYKDAYTKKGHKPECIDCSKKTMKKARDALKKACVKCEKPKTAISFSGDSKTCKVCEKEKIAKANPVNPKAVRSSRIDAAIAEASYNSTKISENALFKKGIERIKKKGFIKDAVTTNAYTTITLSDGYKVKMKVRVDGVPIDYVSKIFANKKELEKHIDFVFNNPRLIAGEYLGVM